MQESVPEQTKGYKIINEENKTGVDSIFDEKRKRDSQQKQKDTVLLATSLPQWIQDNSVISAFIVFAFLAPDSVVSSRFRSFFTSKAKFENVEETGSRTHSTKRNVLDQGRPVNCCL